MNYSNIYVSYFRSWNLDGIITKNIAVLNSSVHKRQTGAVVRRCSVKKMFLEILHNSQEKKSLLQPTACNFIKKETLEQVFSVKLRNF